MSEQGLDSRCPNLWVPALCPPTTTTTKTKDLSMAPDTRSGLSCADQTWAQRHLIPAANHPPPNLP